MFVHVLLLFFFDTYFLIKKGYISVCHLRIYGRKIEEICNTSVNMLVLTKITKLQEENMEIKILIAMPVLQRFSPNDHSIGVQSI